jgi:hypothetical protein
MKILNMRAVTMIASALLLCCGFGNEASAITASSWAGSGFCVGLCDPGNSPAFRYSFSGGTASYSYSGFGSDAAVSGNATVNSSTSPVLSAQASGDVNPGFYGSAAISFTYYMEVTGPDGFAPIVVNASGQADGAHGLSQFFFNNDFVLYVKTFGGVTSDCVYNSCTSTNSDSFNVSQNLTINTNTVYQIEMDVVASVFGSGTQSSSASIDPYFEFAPGFDMDGYSFVFSDGVGNGPAATTPLPAASPLFATGLGALGLLGWRRKRKAAAIAA